MFYRDTGFTTAYVGSSNLSNAALSSGLEWNLKITAHDQPHTIRKINATFENYWNSNDFSSDSQMGKGPESSYMKDVITAKRRHLFVKKSDAETNLYYMGTMNIIHTKKAYKKDNQGKDKEITKVTVKMDHPVRDDILRYLKSEI